MRHLLFLLPIMGLFGLPIRCMDSPETSIPGESDSSHYFNAADYKIIHNPPRSSEFQINSIKVNEGSRNRLVLDLALSQKNTQYNFPIIYAGKNDHGTTIKPNEISIDEENKSDSLIRKQFKYSIYGFMSEYSRVYLRLPDQDSVLLELPVTWRPTEK